jgi:hypothetical protein
LVNTAVNNSILKSICVVGTFLESKKPLMYAVAGYAVFNCVNGGVIKSVFTDINFSKVQRYYLI